MTEKEMREIEMQEIGKRLEKIGPKLNGSLTEKELINLVKELERLKEKYKETKVEEGIIIAYARASANLTAYQDLKRREQSVEKLRKLKKAYQGEASEEKIAVAYAWALGNLTAEQDLEGREESVEKLRELKEDCRGKKFEERAVIFYAMWLVNLTAEQDLKGAEKSVEKLEELKKAYQERGAEKKIVIFYAWALVNLTEKQDLKGAEQSVEKLKELKETYQGEGSEEEIVKKYAQALANLTMKQDLKGVKESAEKLKGLMKEYEEKEAVEKEIVIYYAVVLDCLINKELEKSESDYQELIEVLRRGNWKILKSFLEKVNIEADKKEEDKKSFIHALIIYFSYHKIMEKLIFMENKAKLSHYTSMKVLPKLIKPKEENKDSSDNTKTPVRLRCYNVAYMNDPEEGKCLYDCLRQTPRKKEQPKQDQEQQKKWLAENIFTPETENKYGVYFSSLTKAEDNLPMWQSYSAAGTGCSLVFKDDFFAEEIDEASFSTRVLLTQEIKREVFAPMVLLGEESAEKISNNAGASLDDEKNDKKELKIYAYKVFYIDKPEKNQDNEKKKDEIEEKKIEDYINLIRESLWNIAAYFTEDKNSEPVCPDYLKTFLISCLDEIRYLFKSSDYSYEQEVRLLKQVPYSKDEVKLDCEREGLPRTYIEYPKDLEVDEVILGPKAPKREEVAPYIEYCNQRNGTSIKIRSSEIKYR